MALLGNLPEAVKSDINYKMIDYDCRLETFKDCWPFLKEDNCNCTAEKMAKAGFYCFDPINDPGTTRCFLCLKELDGWEPDDDPMKEHTSHSKDCYFLKFKRRRNMMKITVEESLNLQYYLARTLLLNYKMKMLKSFEELSESIEGDIEKDLNELDR